MRTHARPGPSPYEVHQGLSRRGWLARLGLALAGAAAPLRLDEALAQTAAEDLRSPFGPDDQRGALVNLGAAAMNMGQPATAIKYYNDGLALARRSGTPLAQVDLLFRLGKAKLVSNDFKGAAAAYEEAAQISQKSHDRANEAASYHNPALVYEAAKDPVRAAEYKQKAEALK